MSKFLRKCNVGGPHKSGRKAVGALAVSFALGFGVFTTMSLSPSAYAQTTSGDVVGTVTDATGAAIDNASVVATNKATGVIYNATTNASGEFRFSNLPPGSYDIKGSAAGFRTFVLQGFEARLNQTLAAKLVLPVASATTQVEVSAEAGVALDTTTVQLQQTFSNKEVSELPTATIGLGVLNVSLLSPNVATSGGIGAGTGPSVGGQRPRANNFTIEGIDNNNKSVTGPLIYIPNDSVGEFTLITNQFSPEFGHSAGGQFNTNVLSGTNSFHGRAYEYFKNRNMNAIDALVARGTDNPTNPRYDYNRYGGQIGGPIKRDRLFFFANYERQTVGQSNTYAICTPTADGLSTLTTLAGPYGFNSTNLGVYEKYMLAAPSQAIGGPGGNDAVCGNGNGPQVLTVFSGTGLNTSTGIYGSGLSTDIPLGNYQVKAPNFSNFKALTTSGDWTITPSDSFRLRYLYNNLGNIDTAASLPAFFQPLPNRFHLVALSEYHNFSPSLTNEVRVGFNRYFNETPSGSFAFPGLDMFPNLTFNDQGAINVGPDGNAPQSTIQSLYQFTDNISWVKGDHTLKFGFDGRKFISPQSFTQRVRGDYYWNALTEYLHDLGATNFGERSTGNFFYYGDQTSFYGYANDTWRVLPNLSLNYGLRYEFTSVPVGERSQVLNSAASVPGLIQFGKPKPQYTNFAPRVGIDWAPDQKTSVRAGFGMAYDVLYDNLGILSFPPQYSSTNDVGNTGQPQPGDPNFLAGGGLAPGKGTLATFATVADQRAATSAYVPDQKLPYAETWSLGVQRVFASNYTAEVRYLGTRGIHLSTQIRLNRRPKVTSSMFIPTLTSTPTNTSAAAFPTTLGDITAKSNYISSYLDAGFTSSVVSFAPASQSNYNGLAGSLNRRFQNGLDLNFAYTWSKTMDDATADVFSTVLTPRRSQDWLNVSNDYSRSALDRTHRLSLAAIYALPLYKNSHNWFLKNGVGNWEVAPVYTYQSPEYATAQSGVDSNQNGDAAGDRTVINPHGNKSLGSGVTAVYDPARSNLCAAPDVTCAANTVAYVAKNPNAYYIQAQVGALANASRNTLPLRPTNNLDATAIKRFNVTERYSVEFQAQAFNTLNHPQFVSGSINTVDSLGDTAGATTSFLRPNNGLFAQPSKVFSSNSRVLQLAAKFVF